MLNCLFEDYFLKKNPLDLDYMSSQQEIDINQSEKKNSLNIENMTYLP